MTDLPAAVVELVAKVCKKTKSDPEELGRAVEERVASARLTLSVETASAALVAICDKRGFGAVGRKVVGVRGDREGSPIPADGEEHAETTEAVVAPCADLAAALETLRRVVRTKDPNGPMLILVTAGQDHVIDLLDSTVLLGFKGRSGAGKGTALESTILLTRKGQVLSVTTPADLSAALAEGRAIGIPEADSLFHKDPIVAKILRDGYRRGPEYGFMVPVNGKEWKRETRSLFGFKAFDYHVSFDPHVLGRSVVLEMEPDDSVDLAMDAEKKARHLAPVRAFLARESERVKRVWTREKVDALWDSPEFRADVKALGGKVGRDHVCGADLLLVSRLFGWDLAKELRKAIRSRRTLDDLSDEAEVAEAIRELAKAEEGKTCEPSFELPTEQLLVHLNTRRDRAHLGKLTPKGLGSVLADLGFKHDADWLKAKAGPNRDKVVLLPHAFLKELSQPSQPSQTTLEDAGYRDEKPEPGQLGTDGTLGPAAHTDARPTPDELRQRLKWLEAQGFGPGTQEFETIRRMLGEAGA